MTTVESTSVLTHEPPTDQLEREFRDSRKKFYILFWCAVGGLVLQFAHYGFFVKAEESESKKALGSLETGLKDIRDKLQESNPSESLKRINRRLDAIESNEAEVARRMHLLPSTPTPSHPKPRKRP